MSRKGTRGVHYAARRPKLVPTDKPRLGHKWVNNRLVWQVYYADTNVPFATWPEAFDWAYRLGCLHSQEGVKSAR